MYCRKLMIEMDIKKATSCAKTYSRSVNVPSRIIELSSNVLFSTDISMDACKYCKKMHSESRINLNCDKSMVYGSYQAERFGGKYVFFCSLGLTFWVSPISSEDLMVGAIIAGPVLMLEADEFLIVDLLLKQGIKPDFISKFEQYLKDMPIIQPDIVNELSEMLFITSVFVSNDNPSRYLDDRDIFDNQSEIVDYIYNIKTMGGSLEKDESYPLQKEKELLSLISIGNAEESKKLLNEILGYIFVTAGGNFEVIKSRVLELVVLLSRAALEGGADIEQIFGLNYKYLEQIHKFKTSEELNFWLSNIMVRFIDCVFTFKDIKHVDVIYRAVDYIKRNYMRKITLEEIASKAFLSPSYFSKVFKDEMKLNFNTYLNQLRVEVGKNLLRNENISLADVAISVGYEDQSYFTKVFKKLTGVSPGKYKESRGQVIQKK